MSITKSQVIVGLALAENLRGLGFNVCIAGGFCRDVYFNENPKDMDIVIAVDGREDMDRVDQALKALEVTAQGFYMYNESTTERIVGGFKCVGNVDIVLYLVDQAVNSVEHFDFNLNQFVMLGPYDLESAYVVYAGDTSFHELTAVRKDFSDARFGKMREKFIDLTWRYPEGQGPARVRLATAELADS